MPIIGGIDPPPMRDLFVGKSGQNTDQNTGISQPWVRWLQRLFNVLIQAASSINASGIIDSTQAGLTAVAAALGPDNEGQLVYVTDYNHMLRWDGSGFGWGPGENGSGYITPFLNDPSPTTGWQVCDGTATTRLNSDGTTSAVTVPDYSTVSYLKLGTSAAAGPTAASGVTGATSGGTPAGTVSAPVFTGTPDDTGDNDDSVAVQAGAGTVVADDPHTHPFTPAGTNSAPTFMGSALAAHDHSPGTVELQRTQLKAWFRR